MSRPTDSTHGARPLRTGGGRRVRRGPDVDGQEFLSHLAARPRDVPAAIDVLLRSESELSAECRRLHPNVTEEVVGLELLASAERCATHRAYADAYDANAVSLAQWFRAHVLRRLEGRAFLAWLRSGNDEDVECALELLLQNERRLLSRLGAKLRWLREATILDALRDMAGACVTERWTSFDPERGTLEGWFLMVVHNDLLGRARSEQRRAHREAVVEVPARFEPTSHDAQLGDGLELVLRRIKAVLRGKKRRILENELARAFDRPDLPAPLADADLAAELEIKIGSLYAMRAKARSELAPHIEEFFADD